jgi:hypothetical protein
MSKTNRQILTIATLARCYSMTPQRLGYLAAKFQLEPDFFLSIEDVVELATTSMSDSPWRRQISSPGGKIKILKNLHTAIQAKQEKANRKALK